MKKPTVSRLNFKAASFTLLFAVSSIVAGCVTVNVNFPESAVQKATDDYVRDLYRTKEQGKTKATPTPSASSMIHFDLIPSAYAEAEASFKLDSAKTNEIKSKMRAMVPEIIAHKKEGSIGEGNDGMLVVRNPEKIKPLLKKKVEDLVKNENAERTNLYNEIVSSNHLSASNLPQVKKSFTRSFQAESPSGTWVQSADGSWAQKP